MLQKAINYPSITSHFGFVDLKVKSLLEFGDNLNVPNEDFPPYRFVKHLNKNFNSFDKKPIAMKYKANEEIKYVVAMRREHRTLEVTDELPYNAILITELPYSE